LGTAKQRQLPHCLELIAAHVFASDWRRPTW
jgi:hypothetical protein